MSSVSLSVIGPFWIIDYSWNIITVQLSNIFSSLSLCMHLQLQKSFACTADEVLLSKMYCVPGHIVYYAVISATSTYIAERYSWELYWDDVYVVNTLR